MQIIWQTGKWLKGYVKFHSCGGSVEGFLNSCAKERVAVWGTTCRGKQLTGYLSVKDYRRVRPLARRNCIRLRIVEKRGLGFLLRRYRGRWGIPAGAAVFCATLWFLALFVWNIELPEVLPAQEESIRGVLADAGVYEGAFRSSIDPQQVRFQVLMERPEISWLSVNLKGSFAQVEIQGTVFPPPTESTDEPCNLKAGRDGRVLEVKAIDGQIMVKPGEGVAKGDLLVSGVIEHQTGATSLVHARGTVVAETHRELRVEVPLQGTEFQAMGKPITHQTFSFFQLHIPLYLSQIQGEYDRVWQREYLSLFGVRMPIYRTTAIFQPKAQVPYTLTQEQAKSRAMELLSHEEGRQLSGAEIQERSIETRLEENTLVLKADYVCRESIEVYEKIDKIS